MIVGATERDFVTKQAHVSVYEWAFFKMSIWVAPQEIITLVPDNDYLGREFFYCS